MKMIKGLCGDCQTVQLVVPVNFMENFGQRKINPSDPKEVERFILEEHKLFGDRGPTCTGVGSHPQFLKN